MEKYFELIASAKKEMALADHLLFTTLSLVQETKFLLSILEHIIKASKTSLEALMEYEHHWKKLEAFQPNFAVMISIYKEKELERTHKMDPRFFRLMKKLYEMQRFITSSNVRFKRGERYVLSNSDYNITILDKETIKRYLNVAKAFTARVDEILQKEPEWS